AGRAPAVGAGGALDGGPRRARTRPHRSGVGRVPRPSVRPPGGGGQAGSAAADARIENQSPGHSPPALQNPPGRLTPPAPATRRSQTPRPLSSPCMPADPPPPPPAPPASDRCIPPPIQLRPL